MHVGPRDGQKIASALGEIANGHSESESAVNNPGSGPKTVTGGDETAHGQKESGTSHGESAAVHETANGPWNGSATRATSHGHLETESRHCDAPLENPDPEGGIGERSASRSSLR